MKFLFVIAQARSGSTLCQRLINADDNFYILGEHVGLLKGVSESWHACMTDEYVPEYLNRGAPKNYYSRGADVHDTVEWTGLRNGLTHKSANDIFLKVIYNVLRPAMDGKRETVGFKEIRYGMVGDYTVRMLSELCPNSKFIFLYREPVPLIRSHAGCGHFPGTMADRCNYYNRQALGFIQGMAFLKERGMLVEYSELKDSKAKWLDFAGVKWGEKHDRTLASKKGHTTEKFQLSRDEADLVAKLCEPAFNTLERIRKHGLPIYEPADEMRCTISDS